LPLRIRRLETADLPALLALYRHLHASDDPRPPDGELHALWQTILADPAQVYLGGFLGDDLVASATAAIVPNLTRGARPYAVIENVVTRADVRGRGHGSAVIQAMLEECWARSCYKVMLLSASTRDAAHAFYEANGFDARSKQAFVIRR